MKGYLKTIKDDAYYYFAQKNWGVRREYGPYKDSHQEEHRKTPWKHWALLVRLNWHYRVLRRTSWLLNEPSEESGKLPYLDGSESALSKRRKPLSFAKDLMKYDVISFDIFDTMILRPFSRPTDLFPIVGHRLKKIGFYDVRIKSERQAREEAQKNKGNREVTIYDIYKILEERTGIPYEKGIKAELAVENDYCFANPYMKSVYKTLIDQRKTIIFTSDMYLPKSVLEQLLRNAGYTVYDNIFVSCDYGCSKSNGGLYRIIKKNYPDKTIVHVGDNPESDMKQADANGIATRFYRGCHDIGAKYRADNLSYLIGSAYSGIINTYLHNNDKVYSPYYEYGFIYGGLFLLGFCNWIHSRAIAENVEKILFLSRDGVIFQKIFNNIFDDIPNEYFLWSRIANTKYTIDANKDDFLQRVVRDRAVRTEATFSAGNLLDSISLTSLKPLLKVHGLSEDDLLDQSTVNQFEDFFIEEWEQVLKAYSLESEQIKEYISGKVAGCKAVAIVDVGWFGSGPLGLKYLIEEKYKLDCKVHCYVGGATGRSEKNCPSYLLDNTIEPYLFSNMLNQNHYNIHKKTNSGVNSVLFEFFTQAAMPSYAGIRENGDLYFDIPEVENYKITQEIHNGIVDFCDLYANTFKHDPWMLNISGHDAYCPFRFIIKDLTFYEKYFSNVSVARGIGGDQKKQKIVSTDAILTRVGAWKK